LHDTRYEKMWNTFEHLIKNGTISNNKVWEKNLGISLQSEKNNWINLNF
jgi:hypothetical protein